MNEHEREVGRGDPADTARLAERSRPDPCELLAGLGTEVADRDPSVASPDPSVARRTPG
jgi:hypothetical protein